MVEAIRDRIVSIETMRIGDVADNPRNPKKHPKSQSAVLRGVVEEVGWAGVPLVYKSERLGGQLAFVDGHLRKREFPELSVRVALTDLTDAEADYLLLTYDPVGQLAVTNQEKLEELLRDVHSSNAAVDGLLRQMADRAGVALESELVDPGPKLDRAEELRELWRVDLGQVWGLGEHRLICGDATDPEVVERLMAGERAGIMVTDPPCGVDYEPDWRHEVGKSKSDRTIGVKNDDRASWSMAWNLFQGDVAYVWHSGLSSTDVARSLVACKFELRAQIIWLKSRFAISRGHYHWRHEPCWYAVREGAASAEWIGGRSSQTVWADIVDHFSAGAGLFAFQIDETNVLAFPASATTVWELNGRSEKVQTPHATQKPVDCMERPIRNHGFEIVYDLFLGSGTTLIACERALRKCRGVELNPAYCAVALQRWSEMVGRDPVLLEEGSES